MNNILNAKAIKHKGLKTVWSCGNCGHISINRTFIYCPWCACKLDFGTDALDAKEKRNDKNET